MPNWPMIVLLAAALVTGCRSPSEPTPQRAESEPAAVAEDEWVAIASLSGNDLIGRAHVRNTLEGAGIPCAIGGSAIYGVQVSRAHADRAAALLRADALAPVAIHWPPVQEPVWATTPVGLPYHEAIVQFVGDPIMLAVLRERHTVHDVESAPRVVRLDRHARPYRAHDGAVRDGYELRLHLEGDGGGAVLSFMCLAGGAGLRFTGSNGWGAAAER
jgi:hypothetical protein